MVHTFSLSTFIITCASSWERQAVAEIKALFPDATCRVLFFPGNLLVNTETPREEALTRFEQSETRVLGRIVPVDLRADIDKTAASLPKLLEAALELPRLDPAFTFRVTCERRGHHEFGSQEVERFVGDRLVDEWDCEADLVTPEQYVSIEIFQDLAFLSAVWADEVLHKEISQMRKHAPGQRPLNRAEKKLREALHRFRVKLPTGARALDLGSAPGGWARVLAEYCAEVIAVDRADLDERVSALPNVVHVRERAEAYIAEARGPFDLLTCDMNVQPAFAAEMLCLYAPLLRPEGEAILTIKFPSRYRRQHVRTAREILGSCFTDFSVQHLLHNGKETTMYMRRRREHGTPDDRRGVE
jgi:tRNA(Ser,Leu) C12 N-acetylase TAN1